MSNQRLGKAVTIVAMLVCAVNAQRDLSAEIVAASRPSNDHELRRLLRETPISKVIDALLAAPGVIGGPNWFRIGGTLERQCDGQLKTLWSKSPKERRDWARFFGRVRLGWARLHTDGTDVVRADLEHLATWMDPHDRRAAEAMCDPSIAASAAKLQRIASRAERQRAHPEWEAILRPTSNKPLYAFAVKGGAFALAEYLVDEASHVRAAALHTLRKRMRLPIPDSVTLRLVEHANPVFQEIGQAAVRGRSPAAQIAALAAGASAKHVMPNLAKFSPEQRSKIAHMLYRRGLSTLTDGSSARAASNSRNHFGQVFTPEELQRVDDLRVAIQAKPELGETLLALAFNTDKPRLLKCAIYAASQVDIGPGAAGVLEQLLDDDNAACVIGAVSIANRLLAKHTCPDLQEKIAGMAQAAVAKDVSKLRFAGSGIYGERSAFWRQTGDVNTQCVLTASRHGCRRLIDPLIAALAQAPQPRADAAYDPHVEFLLHCLGWLASDASPKQASKLLPLLVGRPGDNAAQAVCGLVGAVSDDQMPRYRTLLAAFRGDLLQRHFAPLADVDSIARLQRVLKDVDIAHASLGRLIAKFCPDRVQADWQAGDERRDKAVAGVRHAISYDVTAMLARLPQWPAPMVAEIMTRMTGYSGLSLDLLVHVSGSEQVHFALPSWIRSAKSGSNDIAALTTLSKNTNAGVALAAARRALSHGADGVALGTNTIERLLHATELKDVRDALLLATERKVTTVSWQDAVKRLRDGPKNHHQIANAAAVQLGGASVDTLGNAVIYIEYAKLDVDFESLRPLIKQPDRELPKLMHGTTTTCAAALAVAATIPAWSFAVEKAVLARTLDERPVVRRAAYKALASRDPELWQCAWLVHEAAFDDDATVRAVAPAGK